MALGIERALAAFVATELTHELYDFATAADRVVFVGEIPPVPKRTADLVNFNDLTITLFRDGGGPRQGLLREEIAVTVTVRHPLYETAMIEQRRVEDLLHENGGGGNGAKQDAVGLFGDYRVSSIRAAAGAVPLGRDQSGSAGRFTSTQTFDVVAVGGADFT